MNIIDAMIFSGLLFDIKKSCVVALKTIVAFEKFINIMLFVGFCYGIDDKKEKSTNKMHCKNNKCGDIRSADPLLPRLLGGSDEGGHKE
ncbi:MAG: hypothetical protein ACI4A8_07830 [Muribaculaceae bacterium]